MKELLSIKTCTWKFVFSKLIFPLLRIKKKPDPKNKEVVSTFLFLLKFTEIFAFIERKLRGIPNHVNQFKKETLNEETKADD